MIASVKLVSVCARVTSSLGCFFLVAVSFLMLYLRAIILFAICTQTMSVVSDAFKKKKQHQEPTEKKATKHIKQKAHQKPFGAK